MVVFLLPQTLPLETVEGEYVLQLDAEMMLFYFFVVEMLVNVLDKNDVGFVYGDSYLTDQTGKVYGMANIHGACTIEINYSKE